MNYGAGCRWMETSLTASWAGSPDASEEKGFHAEASGAPVRLRWLDSILYPCDIGSQRWLLGGKRGGMERGLNPEYSAVRKPGFKSQPATHIWKVAHCLTREAAVLMELEGGGVFSSCQKARLQTAIQD